MKQLENTIFSGKYPEIAKNIAEIRGDLSKSIYRDGSEKDRGDRDLEIQTKGILCELIARDYMLKKHKKGFVFTPLIEYLQILKPNDPDLLFKDATFDIKYGSKNLNINYNDHHSKKRPQFYWFIVPISKTEAENYVFKGSDVDNWELMDGMSGSRYYRHKLNIENVYDIIGDLFMLKELIQTNLLEGVS